MNRVIFDTNIFLSAFFFGGKIKKVLDKGVEEFSLCFSDVLVQEILTKFDLKFQATALQIETFKIIIEASEYFYPVTQAKICRDPKDNFLLDLAEESGAMFLVTGDKDLLVLEQWCDTKIISPAEFLDYKS